jgi:hypothetical protein
VGHGAVVAYVRHGVLSQGHRHLKELGVHLARHSHLPQHIEADQPQLNHTRLDRGHVHGVDAPGVPQPFGRGGDVGGFLPWSESETEPQPGRGRADDAPARRYGTDLTAGGGLDRQHAQPGRSNGEAAGLHDRAVRVEEPGRGYRQADSGPVHPGMLGPGVGGPAAECGDRTTHLQECRQIGHQAAAPVAAGKAAGVTAAAR